MGMIKKITRKNPDQRTPYEPFAAIKYNGSYQCASTVLGMIGLDNMDLTNYTYTDTYELIDKLMDDNSNLRVPEILQNDETGLIPRRPMTLHVDSWMVLEVSDSGKHTEIVFYPESEFNSKFWLVAG